MLARRLKFAVRSLQLLEQSDILNGNHRLVSKGLQQLDMALVKRTSLGVCHH